MGKNQVSKQKEKQAIVACSKAEIRQDMYKKTLFLKRAY